MFMIFGIGGLLIISYAIWVRPERRQDVLYILGGLLLLAYSFSIGDTIFIVLQIVFIASALFNLIKLNKRK